MEVNGQTEKSYNIFDQKHIIKFRGYKAATKEDYEKRLYASSVWQLSEEAARLGLAGKFSNDRRQLIRKLVKQYVQDKGKYDLLTGSVQIQDIPEENRRKLEEMFAFMRR